MRRLLLLSVGLAVLVWLGSGLAVVQPEERAVVRRFGQVVAQPRPGLWIGFPLGIDRIDRVKLSTVRQLSVGVISEFEDNPNAAGQYLTGDQNLIQLRVVVEYVVDPTAEGTLAFILQEAQHEKLLERECESLIGEYAAGVTVDQALLAGRALLPVWLLPRLQDRVALLQLGLQIQNISLELSIPPAEVRPAFEAVNQAQIRAGTQENQAQQEAATRQREAEIFRTKTINQAEAEAESKRLLAQAEANAFLERWQQYRFLAQTNPGLLQTIWWNELGEILTALKVRGRVDLLDSYLGANGLDITQFLAPKKP